MHIYENGNQAGIPGGGLFNDIFNAHMDKGVGGTDPRARQRPARTSSSVETPGCGWGCGWAVASFFLVLFIGPLLVPSEFAIPLMLLGPPIVWAIGWAVRTALLSSPAQLEPAQYEQEKSASSSVRTYPSPYAGHPRVDEATLRHQCREIFQTMQATGNVPDYADTTVAGFQPFFGAACEVSTAKALAGLPQCQLVNDIAIRRPNGHVTANIDHLACFTDGTYVMVDSKFWSQPPVFEHGPVAGMRVSPTGPHAKSVATCVYEASFLPQTPRAIVFAVRGKAASSLRDPVAVHTYLETDYNGFTQEKRVPCPVIFVASDKIAGVVADLARGQSVAGRFPVESPSVDITQFARGTTVNGHSLIPTTQLDF